MTRDILALRKRDASIPPPLLKYRSSYRFILSTICIAVFTVRYSYFCVLYRPLLFYIIIFFQSRTSALTHLAGYLPLRHHRPRHPLRPHSPHWHPHRRCPTLDLRPRRRLRRRSARHITHLWPLCRLHAIAAPALTSWVTGFSWFDAATMFWHVTHITDRRPCAAGHLCCDRMDCRLGTACGYGWKRNRGAEHGVGESEYESCGAGSAAVGGCGV